MFSVRPMQAEDTAFVFDSWLKSWRKSRYAGVIPNHLYYSVNREAVEGLVSRGAEVWVVVSEKDANKIVGWMCSEVTQDGKAVLHYLYIKDPYLKFYPDKLLLDSLKGTKPGFFTYKYDQVQDALERKWPKDKWSWVPEIARRKQ